MATENQINANRQNAQNSTGPRTESGKAVSSRNALTLGLFTNRDYVRKKEQPEYDELCARCAYELRPEGILEETHVTTIVSATWLLRRCAIVERELAAELPAKAQLDPIRDPWPPDIQASINRARSHASLLLRRSTAELRRLQTDRALANKLLSGNEELPPLAGVKQTVTAIDQHRRAQKGQDLSPQNPKGEQNQWSLASNCKKRIGQAADATERSVPLRFRRKIQTLLRKKRAAGPRTHSRTNSRSRLTSPPCQNAEIPR